MTSPGAGSLALGLRGRYPETTSKGRSTAWATCGRTEITSGGNSTTDIAGYKVQAIDGEIGSIDEATYQVGASYVVVECGPWIIGKKVVLPAGLIERVDLADERVYINRTKEDICNAPEFDEARYRNVTYHIELEEHYGEGGPRYRAHDSPLADPLLRL